MDAVAVMKECKELSLQGKIPFPEVVRRLHEAGVERYHVDLTRDETTYYLPCRESHVSVHKSSEGKWQGNPCVGCKMGIRGKPALRLAPQKRLVFVYLVPVMHRGDRFCIGK